MRLASAAISVLGILAALPASAATDSITFNMVRSPGLAPFPTCVPNARATVTINSNGPVEVLNIFCSGLPPNTDFDFFVIQAPNGPFGLCWYQGDLESGPLGNAAGQFIGRFSIETFIVAPGVVTTPVPRRFTGGPFPSVGQNSQTAPVQLYHLGVWFNNPADAVNAGGPGTVTPFNGEHNAGVQVLNTRACL